MSGIAAGRSDGAAEELFRHSAADNEVSEEDVGADTDLTAGGEVTKKAVAEGDASESGSGDGPPT